MYKFETVLYISYLGINEIVENTHLQILNITKCNLKNKCTYYIIELHLILSINKYRETVIGMKILRRAIRK